MLPEDRVPGSVDMKGGGNVGLRRLSQAMEGFVGIDGKLLEILACPVCKTPVKLDEDGEDLFCARCGRLYPIRDDIPVMLVEEARIKEDK